jgi:hypothetical protein
MSNKALKRARQNVGAPLSFMFDHNENRRSDEKVDTTPHDNFQFYSPLFSRYPGH